MTVPAVSGSFSGPQLADITAFIGEHTGLTFPENRQSSAIAGITRAMKRLGVTDVALYRESIARGGLAMDDLLAELTVGETYFFREPAQFKVLREEIIPRLSAARPPSQGIRAWSAACASGEEAYSLAITLQEERFHTSNMVLGTDLSRVRLAGAQRARFRRWSLRGMSERDMAGYFRKRDDLYELLPKFRKQIEFQYLNLAEDLYPSMSTGVWGMDIILCRNVLIYFDRATIARVGARLLRSLSDDGWLLLGASDPVLSDVVRCEVVQTEAGLMYRKSEGVARSIISHRPFPSMKVEPAVLPVAPVAPVLPLVTSPSPVNETFLSVNEISPPVIPAQAGIQGRARHSLDPRLRGDDRGGTGDRREVSGDDRQSFGSDEVALIIAIRDLANRGHLEDAGRTCATALDQYRLSSELLYLHAILLAQANRPRESAVAARRALYIDRNMIVAYLALAAACAHTGRSRAAHRALANAEKLLAAMPRDAIVPASDGEPAGRLLAMVRVQYTLLTKAA